MQIALIHKHFDAAHLDAIKGEMGALGTPVIKAVWLECHGVWAALEGCHRVRAAKALGLVPEIEEIEWSDELTQADVGILDGDDSCTIAEITGAAHRAVIIKFETAE